MPSKEGKTPNDELDGVLGELEESTKRSAKEAVNREKRTQIFDVPEDLEPVVHLYGYGERGVCRIAIKEPLSSEVRRGVNREFYDWLEQDPFDLGGEKPTLADHEQDTHPTLQFPDDIDNSALEQAVERYYTMVRKALREDVGEIVRLERSEVPLTNVMGKLHVRGMSEEDLNSFQFGKGNTPPLSDRFRFDVEPHPEGGFLVVPHLDESHGYLRKLIEEYIEEKRKPYQDAKFTEKIMPALAAEALGDIENLEEGDEVPAGDWWLLSKDDVAEVEAIVAKEKEEPMEGTIRLSKDQRSAVGRKQHLLLLKLKEKIKGIKELKKKSGLQTYKFFKPIPAIWRMIDKDGTFEEVIDKTEEFYKRVDFILNTYMPIVKRIEQSVDFLIAEHADVFVAGEGNGEPTKDSGKGFGGSGIKKGTRSGGGLSIVEQRGAEGGLGFSQDEPESGGLMVPRYGADQEEE